MHARILLPSLFAAALISTAAFAERTDNDEGAPIRSSAKERVVRESRAPEARERVQHKDVSSVKPVKERAAPARLQTERGCATEDGGSCSKKDTTQKTAAKSSSRANILSMPARLQAQRGCTTDDGSGCSSSEPKTKQTSSSSASTDSKHLVGKGGSQQLKDTMMRMRLEIEVNRILDMLMIGNCQRNGNCGEDEF